MKLYVKPKHADCQDVQVTDRELRQFDCAALYDALDERRQAGGLSWRQLADQIWELSYVLNEERKDHPISPATLSNMAKTPRATCQHVLFMLRWLERTPESFLAGFDDGDDPRFALPRVGPDRRLRWHLKRLHATLNEQRSKQALTWKELAALLSCTTNQLTGLSTAKFATGIELAMRIVQWLDRPAVDFIYRSTW